MQKLEAARRHVLGVRVELPCRVLTGPSNLTWRYPWLLIALRNQTELHKFSVIAIDDIPLYYH
jgi:hypothetical protein